MGNYLVLQSDFGLSDGAVSAMYGVAYTVSDDIRVENLTHDIPPYDIWVTLHSFISNCKILA